MAVVAQSVVFPPFSLDLANEQLWRGDTPIVLRRQTFAVLRYLIEHAGQVVTKQDLLEALWPGVYVTDVAPMICINELRKTLGDQVKHPHFIETVHRRGYRFIASIATASQPIQSPTFKVQRSKPEPAPSTQHLAPFLVGREAELTQLHTWFDKAAKGERQIVFVTGEPGIGKTTLVEAFLQSLASSVQSLASQEENQKAKIKTPSLASSAQHLIPSPWIARGQCIEHYGVGEAYLPVLEALGRLCREVEGTEVIALLRQHAPTWLVQMPAVLSTTELEELQRLTTGVTRERMLRELAEALEALTAARTLILRIEDLHWSDYSTLDLLSVLARRHETARLLILGTYRPAEVLTREHPLNGIKRELQLHDLCEELALDFLSEEMVTEYLQRRFKIEVTNDSPFHRLARVIHRRTDGSPLFMVNVVNDLIARGVVTQTKEGWDLQSEAEGLTLGTPVNLRQLIEQQIERVSAGAHTVLETASVVGADFSAAAVAAGTDQSVEAVEEQCEALVRREQFLRSRGTIEWPDGTATARYGFVHALYQEVLYEQLSSSRRIRLHRQIGERVEQGYGEQARELAAELAVHFERGREHHKAVWYQQQAGQRALQRSANHEALAHLTKGLALLKLLPATTERLQQELVLQTMLGSVLIAAKGYAAPETGAAYAQARQLCEELEETTQLFPVLAGLWGFYVSRPEHTTAYELGKQLLHLAESRQDPTWLVEAHWTLGLSLFCLGELSAALTHLERSIAVAAAHEQSTPAFLYGHDPVMSSLCFVANTLWHLGYPEQALQRSQAAVAHAREVAHPYSQAYALGSAAQCRWLRREEPATIKQAEAGIRLSDEHGIPLFSSMGAVLRGRVRVEQGEAEAGIEQMRQGLVAYQATGAGMMQPYFHALLAEGYEKVGHIGEGLTVVAQALAMIDKTGERWYEAELYRLKGELTLQQFQVSGSKFQDPNTQHPTPNTQAEAETYFLKAIEVAQQQQAKSLELRATVSLARLWWQQGKQKQARKLLAEIYGWFTEGFDTADLKEAKTLLEELV